MPRSPLASPARKRQRLSSPTYDDQVGELTQEDLAAFDAINVQLSQALNAGKPQELRSSQLHQPSASFAGPSFAKASSIQDDADNPFKNKAGSAHLSKLSIPPVAFASATSLLAQDYTRSPSPEEPPEEPKFDDWFNPAPTDIMPVFQIPKISTGSAAMGFTTASKKAIIMPSEEALAKAKAQLDAWNKEEEQRLKEGEQENILPPSVPATALSNIGFKPATSSPLAQSHMRAAFQPVSNIVNTPGTPSPTGFSRPSVNRMPTTNTTPNTSYRPKQFKSPMLRQPLTPSYGSNVGSPLNPHRNTPSLGFASAASQFAHPLAAAPIVAPQFAPAYASSSSFVTPLRAKPAAIISRTTPAPFKTPFKSGMRPLVPSTLGKSSQLSRPDVLVKDKVALERPTWNPPFRKTFFSMTSPVERKTLSSSGLRPQQHGDYELEDMGIDIAMLSQITPETASFYNFHTTSSPPSATLFASRTTLGPKEALEELLQRGCNLATQPWVDNHWGLVLWKLAGMVVLDPEKEANPDEARWCWSEVMRQLLYRYERELNGGSRPPLRKIANQDAPAAFPLVLCVSKIIWPSPNPSNKEEEVPIFPHPELELTDGWYCLRAQVDLPMARAVRKGIIKVGRKLGIAGARLSTEKKDASEILDAYNSTCLVLSGNSSHLMPWHTKLGFTRGPCISTLHSLTADGGIVAALDFVIVKAHPIAYIEFTEDEDGNKVRIGPRNEAEELQVNEIWKRQREKEVSKLREENEKKFARFEGYIDRLERKAGNQLQNVKGSDSYPPDQIDSLFDELEYPETAANLLARISPTNAAWLSLHIRRENEKEREQVGEEMEKELQTICPPREVRSFRVLIVQDARTHRRPANRNAQLTVWDVTSLSLDEEGSAGSFEAGQRFMATNLMPQQPSAWMGCAPGSEVYLSTRRDTRWTRIKKTVMPA